MNMNAARLLIASAMLPAIATAGVLDDLVDKTKDRVEHTIADPLSKGASPPVDGAAAASEPHESGTAAASTAAGVQGAQIDGVRLGMRLDEALQQLREHGFTMRRPSAASPKLGVTVKGRGPMPDGLAPAQITLRSMNDVVYWVNKTASYIPGRMSKPVHLATLRNRLRETHTDRFDTRYSETALNGELLHFDDTSPPPYNRRILTPHASVALNEGRGMLMFRITMEWKDLVGANW